MKNLVELIHENMDQAIRMIEPENTSTPPRRSGGISSKLIKLTKELVRSFEFSWRLKIHQGPNLKAEKHYFRQRVRNIRD